MKKTMILMTALALLTGCAETAAQSLNETEETVRTVNETRTDTRMILRSRKEKRI